MTDPSFIEFENIEEAIRFMRDQEAEANKHIHPKQQAVGYGDHWIRFWDLRNRICIFGKATDATYYDEKIAAAEDGEDREEWEYEKTMVDDAWKRGYVYGQAYSVIEPAGEWGSTHMVNLWPIDGSLFEYARLVGWDVDKLPEVGQALLEVAYKDFREHTLHEAGLL